MLELTHVTKSFQSLKAVDDISVTFENNKSYVLLGPSGCGKSTLLKLLIGLLNPDKGQVNFDGADIREIGKAELRRRYGYVIQTGGLFPHLTARQNISLPANWHRWSDSRVNDRIRELSRLTSFPADGLERYPVQLSGGQRQRVGLMRALMLEPDVLLLDEPLGALDPMIRSQLQSDLQAIFRELNKTVVIVTHDLHEAAWFADEIILMKAGEIVQRGSIDELVKQPVSSFVSDFVRAQQSHLAAWDHAGKRT